MSDAYSEEPDEAGETAYGSELELWLIDDDEEDVHSYSVSWQVMFGLRLGMRCETAEQARKLFEALKHVNDIEG